MDIIHLLILLGAGLVAGFVAGLIGVGGGIIFAPVLFFYYQSTGIAADVIAPLTIGSSLFCTLLAAIASAWKQYDKDAVITRVAVTVGIFSALSVFLTTRFVTTQPWYDGNAFQVVFSIVLLTVVARMVTVRKVRDERAETARERTFGWPALAAAGTAAGTVSAAAGVGGGVVLVPAYSQFMRLPIRLAVGTSSTTIVLISLAGVLNYSIFGWADVGLFGAVGYVDVVRGMVIAVPSLLTANIGVRVAHRMNQRALRVTFASIATVVAVRLLVGALG
jgi:hypothetical protein